MGTRDSFTDLLKSSVLVQSIVTLMLLATLCTMWLVPVFSPGLEVTIPGELLTIAGTVLGYWFKAKGAYEAGRRSNRTIG